MPRARYRCQMQRASRTTIFTSVWGIHPVKSSIHLWIAMGLTCEQTRAQSAKHQTHQRICSRDFQWFLPTFICWGRWCVGKRLTGWSKNTMWLQIAETVIQSNVTMIFVIISHPFLQHLIRLEISNGMNLRGSSRNNHNPCSAWHSANHWPF